MKIDTSPIVNNASLRQACGVGGPASIKTTGLVYVLLMVLDSLLLHYFRQVRRLRRAKDWCLFPLLFAQTWMIKLSGRLKYGNLIVISARLMPFCAKTALLLQTRQ